MPTGTKWLSKNLGQNIKGSKTFYYLCSCPFIAKDKISGNQRGIKNQNQNSNLLFNICDTKQGAVRLNLPLPFLCLSWSVPFKLSVHCQSPWMLVICDAHHCCDGIQAERMRTTVCHLHSLELLRDTSV